MGMLVGAFVISQTGAALKRRKSLAWRSDRDLRAGQMNARVPWELVRSVSLLPKRARKWATLAKERPGALEATSCPVRAKKRGRGGYRQAKAMSLARWRAQVLAAS